jgi:hypothetical protein
MTGLLNFSQYSRIFDERTDDHKAAVRVINMDRGATVGLAATLTTES